MMDCEEVLARLDDYVDGELSDSEAQGIAAHLEQCPECRAEETALRGLLEDARRLPNSILPRRDLWPEIEARIAGRVVDFSGAKVGWRSGRIFGQAIGIAAMIAVVSGLLLFQGLEDPNTPPTPTQTAIPASAMEQEFLGAKTALLAELEASRNSLSPEIIATVEENLRIIEDAVLDIRVALADEPDNPQLERMLIATYKSQVELLQQTVIFANEG